MSCVLHFYQLAFFGFYHGGHWSLIQISPSPPVVSFDLCLQRPFSRKLGEMMDFLKVSAALWLGCSSKPLHGSPVHDHAARSCPGAPGPDPQGDQQALPMWVVTATCILRPAVTLSLCIIYVTMLSVSSD